MKKYKNSAIVMKAYPFHLGHAYLIDTASSRSDNVFVFVCTLNRETISGEDRYNAVRDHYKNTNVNVIHISEDLPQYPEESENFWDIWYHVIYDNVNVKIDALFSSENYGEKYSEILGCSNEIVDIERSHIKISGTEIRNNIIKNWEFLPEETKKFMSKKIAIVGPESTGKTTITKMLANKFNSEYQLEYAREYIDLKFGGEYDMTSFSIEDIINISNGHMKRYKEKTNTCKTPFLFFDTELITTMSWSDLYFKKIPSSLYNMISDNKFDVFLLYTPEVSWVDDGTRKHKDYRDHHFNSILSLIREYGKSKVFIIEGNNYEERFNKSVSILESL